MACEKYESSLIDAALGEPLPAVVAAHLSGCAACQAFLAEQTELAGMMDGVLHAAVAAELSADFLARVRRRVDQERTEDRPEDRPEERPVWQLAAWATIAAVLVGIAIGVWRRPPVAPTKVAEVRVTPLLLPTVAPVPVIPTEEKAAPRERAMARHAPHGVPQRQPEVLIDRAAAAALARYARAMRTENGAIAGSLEARVAAKELPRYEGVLLESTAATEDLPRVSVLEEPPRYERSGS